MFQIFFAWRGGGEGFYRNSGLEVRGRVESVCGVFRLFLAAEIVDRILEHFQAVAAMVCPLEAVEIDRRSGI